VETKKEPAYLKVNVRLEKVLAQKAEELFRKYKDVFS
jgi:hypothetical protein